MRELTIHSHQRCVADGSNLCPNAAVISLLSILSQEVTAHLPPKLLLQRLISNNNNDTDFGHVHEQTMSNNGRKRTRNSET